jgi:hypothetical protein
MTVRHVQFMALGLSGVETPMLVDVVTKHKHPRLTVHAIEHLITPAARYALKIIHDCLHVQDIDDEMGILPDERLKLISDHLKEDPHGQDAMGGAIVLLGLDISHAEVAGVVHKGTICGPDSAVYLAEHPDVIFSFHATNNNGGNTYVMTRNQFVTLFPNEPIEVLTLNT